uniref:Uncharacterized mitochondrial protein ymf32 n=1 Tax=Marchantia polymorpha TaxID=3197 RepID=YMF32_MARPO|nr:hypothetical protein MapooMp51 [Marchantia paleacea]P38474.1 RecName: Full=Uncharacterized mitochondrial protein ymf32; AltName: Full=ORF62 [Marchantia polymorpha]AAC09448.1 ORF62 [Marchantia paleacea]
MSEIAKWLNTRFQLTLIPKENSNTEFVGPCIFREDGDNTKLFGFRTTLFYTYIGMQTCLLSE